MKKMIPFEKLSKKEQKKQNAARRGTWGNIKPITRKPDHPNAYNRQKVRKIFSHDWRGIADSIFAHIH